MTYPGELAALAAALCWAATGLFFTEAARRIGATAVNLLRLPIAWVLLSTAIVASGTSLASLDGGRVLLLALSGLLGLTLGDLALFAALVRIGPRLSSLLMALAPAFATLAGLAILGERPTLRALAGMATTLGGVAWVVGERTPGTPSAPGRGRAVALAVVAAACQGVGLVLAKRGMAGEVPPLAATWVRMGVATLGMGALALGSGRLGKLCTGELDAALWRASHRKSFQSKGNCADRGFRSIGVGLSRVGVPFMRDTTPLAASACGGPGRGWRAQTS